MSYGEAHGDGDRCDPSGPCVDKIARSYYNSTKLQIIQGVVVCDTRKLEE